MNYKQKPRFDEDSTTHGEQKKLYCTPNIFVLELSMKQAKKFKEYFEDIRPVTDEELEELLNDPPGRGEKNKKLKKAKKELYREH
ncbi:MAG: hypothetical protein QXY19_07705 [Archaeoglobaceae archaeon]